VCVCVCVYVFFFCVSCILDSQTLKMLQICTFYVCVRSTYANEPLTLQDKRKFPFRMTDCSGGSLNSVRAGR
jgi:hypothetical protein